LNAPKAFAPIHHYTVNRYTANRYTDIPNSKIINRTKI